jgi:hypothetical protein
MQQIPTIKISERAQRMLGLLEAEAEISRQSSSDTIRIHRSHWRDGDFALCCPGCGGNCLHHNMVTVYSRRDERRTVETRISGRIATMDLVPSDRCSNPSSRHDGLAISFWCEGCSLVSELTIEQHKGQTFFAWR